MQVRFFAELREKGWQQRVTGILVLSRNQDERRPPLPSKELMTRLGGWKGYQVGFSTDWSETAWVCGSSGPLPRQPIASPSKPARFCHHSWPQKNKSNMNRDERDERDGSKKSCAVFFFIPFIPFIPVETLFLCFQFFQRVDLCSSAD
jgi:hypothetical protein